MFSRELTFGILFSPSPQAAVVSFSWAMQPSHVSLQQRHVQPEPNRGARGPKKRSPWTGLAAAAASRMNRAHVHVSANCPVSVAVGDVRLAMKFCVPLQKDERYIKHWSTPLLRWAKVFEKKKKSILVFLYWRNQALINCPFRNSVCLHLLTCLAATGILCWISEHCGQFSPLSQYV